MAVSTVEMGAKILNVFLEKRGEAPHPHVGMFNFS